MCGYAPDLPAANLGLLAVAGDGRIATLQRGVNAIIDAMAGEVQFANDNEAAFALFRKGCLHCEQFPEILDAVGPKTTIVDFLARVAVRRTTVRQVQELAVILGKAKAWRVAFGQMPPALSSVLSSYLPLQVMMTETTEEEVASVAKEPRGPGQDARIFLRECQSLRWLTVIERSTSDIACTMTECAASLFVCHRSSDQECEAAFEEDAAGHQEVWGADANSRLGFEHEGVPACGRFLAVRPDWRQGSLRDALLGSGDLQLRCTGRQFGRQEEFRWCKGDTVQHLPSGLWLYVDPQLPEQVLLNPLKGSSWEALPAI